MKYASISFQENLSNGCLPTQTSACLIVFNFLYIIYIAQFIVSIFKSYILRNYIYCVFLYRFKYFFHLYTENNYLSSLHAFLKNPIMWHILICYWRSSYWSDVRRRLHRRFYTFSCSIICQCWSFTSNFILIGNGSFSENVNIAQLFYHVLCNLSFYGFLIDYFWFTMLLIS